MKGSKIIVATIVSTVIHFFILTLMDTIPLISKEIPQRNLYMVDLVEPTREQPAPPKEEKPVVQQKVEEVKKEEEKKEEVKKEEVKKEEVKKEEVRKEEPKQETVKEETNKDTVVLEDPNKEKATNAGTEKPAVNDEHQRLAAIKEIEQKVAGRTTDDAPVVTDDEIEAYTNTVIESVKRSWAILNIWSEEELEAFIVIEVDDRGYVTSRFEKSSGSRVFDDAALRAIRKAAPFDPPPGNQALTFPPMRFSSR